MNTKEKILNTAIKLFVKQGFENTPTSQISKEAKIATGTLFHHFKTKEELINEVYKYVKKSMGLAVYKGFDENTNDLKKVEVIWKNLLSWGFSNRTENEFLKKFYGSSYIDSITVKEANEGFEKGAQIFVRLKKEKKIKEISSELFHDITMSLYNSFLPEFYKIKILDKKLLDLSFKIYWDAIKNK